MPYSRLLMTFIFINPSSWGAGKVVGLAAYRVSRKEAATRDDVQCFGSRSGGAEDTDRGNPCVSTLSLCNANFAPRLA
jgi:hypothetical protein